ncbi:hypothetical protein SFB85_14885, partial [Legionella taurinensis]
KPETKVTALKQEINCIYILHCDYHRGGQFSTLTGGQFWMLIDTAYPDAQDRLGYGDDFYGNGNTLNVTHPSVNTSRLPARPSHVGL